jgi:hypothetical protein
MFSGPAIGYVQAASERLYAQSAAAHQRTDVSEHASAEVDLLDDIPEYAHQPTSR